MCEEPEEQCVQPSMFRTSFQLVIERRDKTLYSTILYLQKIEKYPNTPRRPEPLAEDRAPCARHAAAAAADRRVIGAADGLEPMSG